MNTKPATRKKQAAPVLDWCALTEVQAIMELCNRLDIILTVTPDGKLSATGNTKAAHDYLGDIAPRYRGATIAHLLDLPAPDGSMEQDNVNIIANAQALDVTLTDFCAAAGYTVEHCDKLLAVRRRMAPYLLLQNICAFRAWLFEIENGKGKP